MTDPGDRPTSQEHPYSESVSASAEAAESAGYPKPRPEVSPSSFRAFIEHIGLVPPKGQADPYAHRRGEPRGFTVIWLAYLFLVAGAVYAAIGNPAMASAEGYRLASKVLLTMVGVGILTVWPLLRLTQASAIAGGVSATLRDVAIVLIPMQALIWPQSLITGWSVSAVGAIALVLASWTLIVGAVIAIATGPAMGSAKLAAALRESPRPVSALGRAGAMAAIIVLGVAGPVLSILMPAQQEEGRALLAVCSPLTAPWELFADRSWMGRRSVTLPEHWKPVLLLLVVGLASWGLLLVTRRIGRLEEQSGSA